MTRHIVLSLCTLSLVTLSPTTTPLASPSPDGSGPGDTERVAAAILAQVLHDNASFMQHHKDPYFEPFLNTQKPRATVVACADSRFHLQAIHRAPDGDVFELRNIGNQVDSTEGSVGYAVLHLRTPLLLVIGHVGCGAIKAAMGDYSDEPPAIRRELNSLHLSIASTAKRPTPEQQWLAGVVSNVHQQVANAMKAYREQVQKGQLHVVGAVYDFRNEMGEGRGRLHVININGETQRGKIQETVLWREARRLAPAAPSGRPPKAAVAEARH
jgi:carbonic anhydrase